MANINDWFSLAQVPMKSPANAVLMFTPEEQAKLEAQSAQLASTQVPPPQTEFRSGPPPREFVPDESLSQTSVGAMIPPEIRAQMQDDRGAFKQAINAAQQSLADEERGLLDFKRLGGTTNMAPLAALADAWGGTKLAPVAEKLAGMSPEEKAVLTQKLQGSLTDDYGNLAKMLSGSVASGNMMDLMSKNQRQQKGLDLKMEDTIRNDITKNFINPILDDKQKMEIMDTALATGDSQKIGNVLSLYARSISGEKGVLTDQDITRVMPRNFQGTAAQAIAYFNSTPSSKLAPEYVKSMRELIDLTKTKLAERYKRQLGSKRMIYSAGSYREHMQPGAVGDVAFGEARDAYQSFVSPAAAAPEQVDPIAELLKNRGK